MNDLLGNQVGVGLDRAFFRFFNGLTAIVDHYVFAQWKFKPGRPSGRAAAVCQ
jgi:hypothetical protein